MRIAFEPSGTHLKGDSLKIRLDLFPEAGEKSYAGNYVSVPVLPVGGYPGKVDKEGNPVDQNAYNLWLAGLPHIWQLNPCLSVFVRVDENITKELLTQFIGDVYKPDVLATIDNAMIQSNSAHLISPYCKSKTTLSSAKTLSFDASAKTYIDTRLSGLSIVGVTGKTEIITPQSIDVGPGATDRASYAVNSYTSLSGDNPANASGLLDTVELWATNNLTATLVGTFSGSGTSWASRDWEYLGTVTSGSKQTYAGLTIDVVANDLIGAYWTTADGLERADTGGTSYVCAGNQFGTGAQTYTAGTRIYSLYATGTEGTFFDIGQAPINRDGYAPATYTGLDLGNPASAAGHIDTVKVYAITNLTGLKVGLFYLVSGTTYKCRAVASIGNVTAGSVQSFSVSLDCQAGDVIGAYFATGTLERGDAGGSSAYYSGDVCTVDAQQSFTAGTRIYSLYGTGSEAGTTYDETGHLQTILVVGGKSDSVTRSETGHLQTILAALGASAQAVFNESGHLQLILVTSGNDAGAFHYDETGALQVIKAVTGEAECRVVGETGHIQTILVVTGGDADFIWIVPLTLRSRSTAFTLRTRSQALTLRTRSTSLTLPERT